MNRSIHRFLTINALSAVGLGILLAIVAVFFLRQDSIKLHLDAELSLEAHSLESFITQRLSPKKIDLIQRKIDEAPYEARSAIDQEMQNQAIQHLINNTQFQLWDLRTNKLILHSPNAPSIPLDNKLGYNKALHQSHQWQLFSIEIPHLGYKIVTMQRHDIRLGYEKQFITDTLIVLIMTLLLLIVSLRVIITRSLSILNVTTSELKEREPSNLNPINIADTPLETKPLIIEINRLMSQLKATLEREQQFAANAAHELKTPLAAMKAQIQVANRLPPEAQKLAFAEVEETIARYDHIIRQLLTLSRTLSQSALESIQPIQLDELMQKIIAQLVPLALKRNINIELHHDTLTQINSSASLLTTALTNLIDNAIKYTGNNDTIIIRVERHGLFVYIYVIDHGSGIPDNMKLQALKRFTRIDGTKASGSGLGLSIVSEITEHLKGRLSLETTKPNGLTACMQIPINSVDS